MWNTAEELIFKIIAYPLAVLGFVQVFRGLCKLGNQMESKKFSHAWEKPVLFYGTIFSVVALCAVICYRSYNDGYNHGMDAAPTVTYVESVEVSDTTANQEEAYRHGEESVVMDALNEYEDLVSDISHTIGLHPEEALMVFDDLLSGKDISRKDLEVAVDAVTEYFYGTDSIIYDFWNNYFG